MWIARRGGRNSEAHHAGAPEKARRANRRLSRSPARCTRSGCGGCGRSTQGGAAHQFEPAAMESVRALGGASAFRVGCALVAQLSDSNGEPQRVGFFKSGRRWDRGVYFSDRDGVARDTGISLVGICPLDGASASDPFSPKICGRVFWGLRRPLSDFRRLLFLQFTGRVCPAARGTAAAHDCRKLRGHGCGRHDCCLRLCSHEPIHVCAPRTRGHGVRPLDGREGQ